MLHLLYIIAFTILAVLAIANLVRSLLTLGLESQRSPASRNRVRPIPHPEFLDATGNLIDEPLLVMRSITVEDAREQLDNLFNASPSQTIDTDEKP